MGRIIYDEKLKDEAYRLNDYLISRGFTLWDIKVLLMRMDNDVTNEILKKRMEVEENVSKKNSTG